MEEVVVGYGMLFFGYMDDCVFLGVEFYLLFLFLFF